MSYCRLSSDGFQCDIHAEEDVVGCYTIHCAERRHLVPGPLMYDYLRLNKAGDAWDNDTILAYQKAVEDWHQHCESLPEDQRFAPIDHPSAGESFQLATLLEFRDKLIELSQQGFKFDPGVIAMVNDEMKEKGENHTVTPHPDVPKEEIFQGGSRQVVNMRVPKTLMGKMKRLAAGETLFFAHSPRISKRQVEMINAILRPFGFSRSDALLVLKKPGSAEVGPANYDDFRAKLQELIEDEGK